MFGVYKFLGEREQVSRQEKALIPPEAIKHYLSLKTLRLVIITLRNILYKQRTNYDMR